MFVSDKHILCVIIRRGNMITCPKCGTRLEDGTAFCTNCGTPIDAPAPTPASGSASQNAAYQAPPQGEYSQPQYQSQYVYYDPADHTAEFDAADVADNKIFAAGAYLFGFLGIIVALLVKDSKYLKFHIKWALRLSIAEILALIPAIIPILGWIVTCVLCIILFVVEIMAIVWAFQGKSKDLPILKGIRFLQ